MYQYTFHFDLIEKQRQPFLPTVHRTEVLLGTLHTLSQRKCMLYSQLYASTYTSFSLNKNHYIYVIPSTDVIKFKCSILPYVYGFSFRIKPQCFSHVLQKNVYSCHINCICIKLLPLQEVTTLPASPLENQFCKATCHVVQQTCLSDYISHPIRLIFIQTADQPDWLIVNKNFGWYIQLFTQPCTTETKSSIIIPLFCTWKAAAATVPPWLQQYVLNKYCTLHYLGEKLLSFMTLHCFHIIRQRE